MTRVVFEARLEVSKTFLFHCSINLPSKTSLETKLPSKMSLEI